MRRFLWLILILMFSLNSSSAVEFEPIEAEEVAGAASPKALLNDEDYQINGRVEYDEQGVMFLEENSVGKRIINIAIPKKISAKSVTDEGLTLKELNVVKPYNQNITNEYSIAPTFSAVKYKTGAFTYGTTYGTDMDTGQLEYRTKFFARYDNKFFGVDTAYGKDAYTTSGRQLDSIYFVPELKLGHGFVVKNLLKSNPDIERHKNDVILQYNPKIKNSREIMEIEASVGQVFYKDGASNYHFGFSTNFHL